MADSYEVKDEFVKGLLSPSCFRHEVSRLELVETHISWILLTGLYAYKIKKPVNLGFLDFSTLDKRHYYCHEELRLNRRTAPDIYIAVVPVTGSVESPMMEGIGEPLEWAIKMIQFDNADQLDVMFGQSRIHDEQLDALADAATSFHDRIPHLDLKEPYGAPSQIIKPVRENYRQIPDCSGDPAVSDSAQHIQQWHEIMFHHLGTEFEQRRRQGHVRECHGDLHLRNITFHQGRPVLFDCIEFDPNLRWIDTINDMAFLIMDCWEKGHQEAAFRILNRYLENNGDYRALVLLPFYMVYRAMVRAKVACISRQQSLHSGDLECAEKHSRDLKKYTEFSETIIRPGTPLLIITHGLSGSGKTVISGRIIERLPAIRIRSDVERKRLFSGESHSARKDRIDEGLYSASKSERTYRHLADLAEKILSAGFNVVIDAAFLRYEQREFFREVAKKQSAVFRIISFHAPISLLEQWLTKRQRENRDASDAGVDVLHHQLRTREPLDEKESEMTLFVDTSGTVDIEALVTELKATATRQRPNQY